MSKDLMRELKATFDLAIRQDEARSLSKGIEWSALTEIETRHETAREDARNRFNEEYETRFEQARRDIINKAGEKNHDMPSPYGTDRFKGDAISRQADRRIRQDHEFEMTQIDEAEAREISTLIDAAETRNRSKGLAKDAFAENADRRSGEERRLKR
ncbi:hypothetical protein [Roseibium album]|uniref:Uncharacterized protein n=1 Tax=Roseibium album TaxID=311410 RepID=A0A0M6Z7P6_9HYPH|nr:hypothetical protein [Roseibium album]CTQ58150.1 hypothetical protein LA5094_00907 [Roseibium album]CTQ65690.1 hypothetical protein LA5096_00818 [Roseibium album]CTQ70570.1 hypothetical protein LA5095_01962 [Roseibium album]